MPRKLLFLDGHSLAYRAYFALPTSLATTAGQVTNAVYGFTSMLVKLLGDEKPDGLAVCFDLGRQTFRKEVYPAYKQGRSATPDEFSEQLGLLREVLDVLHVPVFTMAGFEADDLLATFAKRTVESGDEAILVTGDRDVLQLVRPGVSVMMTVRGISDIRRYDRDAVIEKYGVAPEQMPDYAALRGDTSDNLPGVPGVGEKTAAQLVQKYGTVDAVIESVEELKPKIREALKLCYEQIRLNKQLTILRDDVEIPEIDVAREPWDDDEVRKLFTALEFRTLYERLQELEPQAGRPSAELNEVRIVDGPLPEGVVAVAWDHQSQRAAGMVVEGEAVVAEPATFAGRPVVAHDAKSFPYELAELVNDTSIAAYLLEPGSTAGYGLPVVVNRYLGVSLDDAPDGQQGTLLASDDGGAYAARRAAAVHALNPIVTELLRNRGMWELAQTLEFPLVGVLARMERAGVLIDLPYLTELAATLGTRMAALERTIHQHAGEAFNVNSNLQLQKVLFETLNLPKTKKIKTGFSTDQAELAKLIDDHPIIAALVEYRELAKLKSGFTDALIPLVDKQTGRIHTTYIQTSAATGRLASTNPNVQNIPIRGDTGRQIRRAFMAPPGHLLLAADYSQIELRVLAHLTEDEGLLDAFASGHDFHAAIGAKVYGVAIAEATPQMRSYAKQFSYGIAYGMSAYGVSQRLNIPMEDANEFIDAYYAQFPKVKAFLDEQVKRAATEGFTTTMFGRRRYLPELQSPNPRLRAMGERMALNAPIQGSAADLMKKAMIDVDAALQARPHVATMLLSVHDELVFEVPEGQVEEARTLVQTTMEAAAELRCGLAVDIHVGPNWDQAHA